MDNRIRSIRPLGGVGATFAWATLAWATLACLLLPAAGSAQESRGSAVPCAAPLGWHVAEVDPRFGLGEAEVRSAVSEAAGLWEEAVGRPLLPHDPAGPLRISLVFDQRQATYLARRGVQDELQAEGAELDSVRAAVERAGEELDAERATHEAAVAQLLERFDAYNREVERWNREGGAPAPVRTRLASRAETLEQEQVALQREGRELTRRQEELARRARLLNDRILDRNRRARELTDVFSGRLTQAGRYLERVETGWNRIRVTAREIRVFRFENRDDLVMVLAHELGHALGLGHVDVEGAVMGTIMGRTPERGLRPADLRLLEARCPMLR